MNKNKIIIILFSILFLFPIAINAEAEWEIPELNVDIPWMEKLEKAKCTGSGNDMYCEVDWLAKYLAGIYKGAINIIGILAVVVMMYGGVLWITAGGNSSRIDNAKSWIAAAATGLILSLASYTILYQVNPELLKFSVLKIGAIEGDIAPENITFTSGGGAMGTRTLGANVATYDSLLISNARAFNQDCTLMKAIMMAESNGRPGVTSPAGAVGLMQLMPTTAGLPASRLTVPSININAGAKYLQKLSTTACNGARTTISRNETVCSVNDIRYFIASYNGGPGANKASVDCPGQTYWECEKNAGYLETRNYVNTVQSFYQQLTDNGWGC